MTRPPAPLKKLTPLSEEARRQRLSTLPVEVLANALNDKVHIKPGRTRIARAQRKPK